MVAPAFTAGAVNEMESIILNVGTYTLSGILEKHAEQQDVVNMLDLFSFMTFVSNSLARLVIPQMTYRAYDIGCHERGDVWQIVWTAPWRQPSRDRLDPGHLNVWDLCRQSRDSNSINRYDLTIE